MRSLAGLNNHCMLRWTLGWHRTALILTLSTLDPKVKARVSRHVQQQDDRTKPHRRPHKWGWPSLRAQ